MSLSRLEARVLRWFHELISPGFYGLGPYTFDGCLKCFCSGHSSDCTSAPKWLVAGVAGVVGVTGVASVASVAGVVGVAGC